MISQPLTAQSDKLKKIDSLIANAKDDTTKIRLNLDKLDILSNINLDGGIALASKELIKAEEIHYYYGIFLLRIRLANNYTFKGVYDSAIENLKFLEKFRKPSDSLNLASIYGAYGMMYGVKAVYDTSIMYLEKAIPIYERLKKTQELSGIYINVGIGYEQIANYPKALEFMQKALDLAQKNNNKSVEARILVNMGNAYNDIGNTDKAIEAYHKSADLASQTNGNIIELYDYSNLSSIYNDANNWKVGYDYAMKAVQLSKQTGDIGIEAASLSKAALALSSQKKYDEAIKLSKQSIILADSSRQPLNIFQAYSIMGNIFYLQEKYAEAIPFLEKAFKEINSATNYDKTTAEFLKKLSVCYEKTGNYIKALSNYKLSAEIEDSITRKSNIRKATEQSMNFEFAKKQEVLAAEHKKDLELQKTKQMALTIGLVLLFLLGLLALIGFKNKQKANKTLKLQKKKIESALAELKSTQAQLIQSEKMASLGELTAGIAHEIQNPLNFVNNFSEVNKEMIDEVIDEISKGNYNEAKNILNDIKENSEKINHHGKRAADIVKGMLQHSRTSTGQKELTDINALCDEYFRLSYHGLRAKDKTFNAKFETDFDTNLPKINVLPQDIGRVILNLINNAFYAVSEKAKSSKQNAEGYEPTVSVSTKSLGDKVEVKVKDNGNGIPSTIKDKIFQPFFTTKPTGSGTGLGLSLSYDIITKGHAGELKVETKEGRGSEFIILLPG
ncbi:MAG: tetratricopeptide repeat protein [Bacteroidetes bacterium]|nr:tetratricopeptide repeat protein [Bacteroidota bacterium]MBS1931194.1 tetratricopeptide repeat protein [Bacteroidota bacterium]